PVPRRGPLSARPGFERVLRRSRRLALAFRRKASPPGEASAAILLCLRRPLPPGPLPARPRSGCVPRRSGQVVSALRPGVSRRGGLPSRALLLRRRQTEVDSVSRETADPQGWTWLERSMEVGGIKAAGKGAARLTGRRWRERQGEAAKYSAAVPSLGQGSEFVLARLKYSSRASSRRSASGRPEGSRSSQGRNASTVPIRDIPDPRSSQRPCRRQRTSVDLRPVGCA